MALDKLIHNHIDKMDELEEDVKDDIDKIYEGLDIERILNDPEGEMLTTAEQIKKLIIDNYTPKAIENGFDVAEKIDKLRRDIVIQDTDDPKINKEQFNDTKDKD